LISDQKLICYLQKALRDVIYKYIETSYLYMSQSVLWKIIMPSWNSCFYALIHH
jgi:hypothetical protein